jgi:hypothetical protein
MTIAGMLLVAAIATSTAMTGPGSKPFQAADMSSHCKMALVAVPVSEAGRVDLKVHFDSDVPVRIYSWRGHLYPLLGSAVKIRIADEAGRIFRASRVDTFVPEFPHKLDVVETLKYEYPQALRLRISAGPGMRRKGCWSISITYDTRKSVYVNAGLSPIRTVSEAVRICPDAEPATP